MDAIVFDSVCFSYGEEEVLHDVTFRLPQRCFVGVVGPNGGGKTTLMRLILGLQKPSHGTISLFTDSTEVHSSGEKLRTGYVPQHLFFDKDFPATVLDIVLLGHPRKLGRYSASEKQAAHNALEQVGMQSYIRRTFTQLSGGQRQRVLIAQALCCSPHLLLLDEPTANIDDAGAETIHNVLHDLSGKLTIVMVSHNVNTVLDCSTHVLCVNRTTAFNSLQQMHPELIAKARGSGIAVLHHEMSCQVFEKQSASSLHPGEAK